MSTTSLLMVIAVVWSSVGLLVAVIVGLMFRDADPAPEEVANRLLC
jgi:hypothetical protein